MAASENALRRRSSPTEEVNPRPDSTTIATAAVHSRSPVTAAGGICPNNRSARPAPNCTETMPVKIMPAGRAIRVLASLTPTGRDSVSLTPT